MCKACMLKGWILLRMVMHYLLCCNLPRSTIEFCYQPKRHGSRQSTGVSGSGWGCFQVATCIMFYMLLNITKFWGQMKEGRFNNYFNIGLAGLPHDCRVVRWSLSLWLQTLTLVSSFSSSSDWTDIWLLISMVLIQPFTCHTSSR